jgi:AraC-like DNA-binding protein
MLSLQHIPRPPLSEFVRLLWLYDGYSQPHAKERALPTGQMQLIVNLLEDRSCMFDREDTGRERTFRGAIVSGAHSEYQVIPTAAQSYIMGACFQAGGAFPFLRMPASELCETTVSLEALWGCADAAELRERLLAARTHQARFQILEQVLLTELLRQDAGPNAAVRFALGRFACAPQTASIGGVTERTGLSAKRFIQAFRDATGFTPKLFCRILRFQRALECIEESRNVEWTRVALDCGYFDQAHFIHDFRAFSGINPSTYLAHRTPHRNHVPLPD